MTEDRRRFSLAGRGRILAAALVALLHVHCGGGSAGTSVADPDEAPETVRPDVPGARRLVADADNRAWLRYAGGDRFFLCGAGDPEDFLYRGTRRPDGTRAGDQDRLIEKLRATGVNGIYFQAVRSHGGDGDPDHNPFVDGDPRKPLDDEILDQWEGWFRKLQQAGVAILFFIYDDGTRIWDTGDSVGEPERLFLTALVDRFEHHPLLIWVVAEEYQEAYSPARVSEIARIIRKADGAIHPIAVHKLKGLEFGEFADDPNIDQFALQYEGSAHELHEGVVEAWRRARKPSSGAPGDQPVQRYNLNMAEAEDHGTGKRARLKHWAVALGGAYVMVLGMDIAGTSTEDLEDCGRLVSFMESTDFDRMEPHDELALGATDYVLARPGESYIAYSSEARGEIGLRGLTGGTYRLSWFDPRDGKRVRQEVRVAERDVSWTVPAGIGPEAAVHARRLRGAGIDREQDD